MLCVGNTSIVGKGLAKLNTQNSSQYAKKIMSMHRTTSSSALQFSDIGTQVFNSHIPVMPTRWNNCTHKSRLELLVITRAIITQWELCVLSLARPFPRVAIR